LHGQLNSVPHEQIILRCASALVAKFPTQYQRHREAGIISADDCYVVALNHAQAYEYIEIGTPPYILRTVYGLGPLFVTIDRHTREIAGRGVHYFGAVQKSNGAAVNTGVFFSDQAAQLSAVIGSVSAIGPVAYGAQSPLGEDFRLVHNPKARNPLPPGVAEIWRAGARR
jgi:hypothetical protein